MVVQKFGGTSVADPAAIRRLIEIVRAARARDGRGPAVVVSAMSGVTDALLGIASAAGSGAGTTDALARDRAAARAASGGGARSGRRARAGCARGRDQRDARSARRRGAGARRAARGLAAHARRHRRDGRAAQFADGRGGAQQRRHRCGMGGRAPRDRDQRRSHARHAADRETSPRAARDGRGRARRGAGPGARRIRRRDGGRAHDDAGPRRLGLLRRARRRRDRRAGDSDLDRRRRHAHRRSARDRAAAPRAAAVVCRGRGARLFRRQGAAPEHDPARRRAQHSRAHPQLDAAGRQRAR